MFLIFRNILFISSVVRPEHDLSLVSAKKVVKKVEKKFAIAIKSATFASPFEKRASLWGREFIEKVAFRHSGVGPRLRA